MCASPAAVRRFGGAFSSYLRMRALAGLIRGSTCESTPFDGSEATQSAALTFNVPHLLIALAIGGASEIGTSKTAAARSAEHDAVAAANKLRAAVVDRLPLIVTKPSPPAVPPPSPGAAILVRRSRLWRPLVCLSQIGTR